MSDVERDLRELFERKAGSVGGVAPRLPDRVRKRGRRRQLGTALVGGVTALAVVVGSVAALRAIQTDADRGQTPVDDPWAGYEVFERTATVGNFTISSPSDWYLVNQWPWARTAETRLELRAGNRLTPILLLSDTDRGLESSPCLRSSFPIRPGDAVMTLAFDNAHFAANFGAGDRAQWPVSFDSSSDPERPSCGPGTYVYFAAGDIPYVAHFAFGDAVPDDERQTLIDAFEGMRVADSQEVLMQEPKPDDTSAYVIAGGENAAGPWTLELSPQSDPGYVTNVRLELTTAERSGAVAGGPFTVYEERPIEQAGGDPVFGAVVKEADAVELRLEEGTPPIPAQIVPLPPSMPFEFDLFFASNDADVQAAAVAIGPDGTELPADRGGSPMSEEAIRLLATGETAGTPWTLEYVDGTQLALVSSSAEILDAVSGNLFASFGPDNPLVMGLHDFGSGDAPHYFLFGMAQPDLRQVSIVLEDGTEISVSPDSSHNAALLGSGDAPWAWWLELPSGPITARLTAFDDRCKRAHVSTLHLQAVGEPALVDRASCSAGD